MRTDEAAAVLGRLTAVFAGRGGEVLADIEVRRQWKAPLEACEAADALAAIDRLAVRQHAMPTVAELVAEAAAVARRREDSERTLPASPSMREAAKVGIAAAREALPARARRGA